MLLQRQHLLRSPAKASGTHSRRQCAEMGETAQIDRLQAPAAAIEVRGHHTCWAAPRRAPWPPGRAGRPPAGRQCGASARPAESAAAVSLPATRSEQTCEQQGIEGHACNSSLWHAGCNNTLHGCPKRLQMWTRRSASVGTASATCTRPAQCSRQQVGSKRSAGTASLECCDLLATPVLTGRQAPQGSDAQN